MASDVSTDEDSAHALFHSLDAMEGLPGRTPAEAAHPLVRTLRTVYPGFLAAATIGLAAT